MQRKGISILAILVLIVLIYAARDAGAIDAEAAAVAATQEPLLASTVQIEMFGQGWVDGNLKHVPSAQGLGTLVQEESRRFIVTHNHWSVPAAELERVELRNAAGTRLLVLDAATFLSLVRYQDSGTMILTAPSQLEAIVPAALGEGGALVNGDAVLWASQHAGAENPVDVATALVHGINATIAPGVIELHASDAPVVAGDSGGGIWHEGKLVGNLWAITEEPAPDSWRQWLGGAIEWQQTGHIIVALQPLGGVSRLTASDLAHEAANDIDYERGPQRPAP